MPFFSFFNSVGELVVDLVWVDHLLIFATVVVLKSENWTLNITKRAHSLKSF